MIFDDKPTPYVGLCVLYAENLTLRFLMNGGTLLSESEVFGSCYLRWVVEKMLVVG